MPTPEEREKERQKNRARVHEAAPEFEQFFDELRAEMHAVAPGSERGLRITRLEILDTPPDAPQPE